VYPQFLQYKALIQASEIADRMQYPAYIIGGYVRDCFLGRTCKDFDIVVVGDGIEFAKELARALNKKNAINIFKTYGTAQIKYEEMDIEIVGARRESYNPESRNPMVNPGTLDDDQNRRDFTINALALSLNKEDFGALLDPFDGMKDLENKIIRTPLEPGITFSDDPLRMMRAIRFASQLEFTIHPETFSGIQAHAERIRIISSERISEELNQIILSRKPSAGFKLLDEAGLLRIIFPDFCNLKGVEVIEGKGHKDNFYHTLEVLDNISEFTDDLWLRWAAILHDIAKPATKKFEPGEGWTFHNHEFKGSKMVKRIFSTMKLPLNEKMRYVEKLVLLHLRPIALTKENITDSAIRRLIFDAGEVLDDLMILVRADITSKNEYKKKRYLENYIIVEEKIKEVEAKDHIRNWQPPITGELIMQTFHLKPGKEVGVIKTAIREAILDGKISNNYEEAFDLMMEEGRKLGLVSNIIRDNY
jgi:putative nucleotidyltransferase with HDIG domain